MLRELTNVVKFWEIKCLLTGYEDIQYTTGSPELRTTEKEKD